MENKELYQQLNIFFKNFNKENINDYQILLLFIYKIFYSDNIFMFRYSFIKDCLKNIINILKNNNNWTLVNDNTNNNFNLNSIQDYINLYILVLNNLMNFSKYFDLKSYIEQILLKLNLLQENEIIKNKNLYIEFFPNGKDFTNLNVINFFKKYNIDIFKDEYINIKNTIIPNFYLQQKNKTINHYYEFCHLLFKIYMPVLIYGCSFYEALRYKINETDIVFDCGANLGLFSLYAASQSAQVYSFEPMSYNRLFLKQSANCYKDKIHIIPYGLNDIKKTSNFTQSFNPGASHLANNGMVHTSKDMYTEKVQLITIDDFCNKTKIYPTFIKIDTEGHEYFILNGAQKTIKEKKPILSLCLCHHEDDIPKITSLIKNLNPEYNFYYYLEGDTKSMFVFCC